MNKYHVRFNTQHGDTDLVWRIFENGQEHLVRSFEILVPVQGECTQEHGQAKWNVTCQGRMAVVNGHATITADC
jgi:hypothetical protein